jgi:hypothetical protein
MDNVQCSEPGCAWTLCVADQVTATQKQHPPCPWEIIYPEAPRVKLFLRYFRLTLALRHGYQKITGPDQGRYQALIPLLLPFYFLFLLGDSW